MQTFVELKHIPDIDKKKVINNNIMRNVSCLHILLVRVRDRHVVKMTIKSDLLAYLRESGDNAINNDSIIYLIDLPGFVLIRGFLRCYMVLHQKILKILIDISKKRFLPNK